MPGSLAACGRWPVASPRRTEADAKRGLGVTHGARLHPEKLQKLLPGQACREGRIGQTTPLLQRHRDSGEPRGDSLGVWGVSGPVTRTVSWTRGLADRRAWGSIEGSKQA